MMLLARVLDQPHELFYPRLNSTEKLRDAFAAVMAKKSAAGERRPIDGKAEAPTILRAPALEAAAVQAGHSRNDTAPPASIPAR